MHLPREAAEAKLEALRHSEGFDAVEQMLQAAVVDSVSPGICMNCDYTTEVEPDQVHGWCENCRQNTVVSALFLAGIV